MSITLLYPKLNNRTWLVVVALLLIPGTPLAAQFTTVIEIDDPTDVAPQNIDSDTQVNVSGTGVLFNDFDVHNVGATNGSSSNIEVNITGGAINGETVNFYAGSTTNLSGGSFAPFFSIFNDGSTLNYSSGELENLPPIEFRAGSTLNAIGGEFFIDAQLVPGITQPGDEVEVDLSAGGALGGILADGTPLSISATYEPGTIVRLTASALPPPVGGSQITATTDGIPPYLRRGQVLTVDDGAILPEGFFAGPGSRLSFEPGSEVESATSNLMGTIAIAAEIDIQGGEGIRFTARNGSQIALTDGMLSSGSSVASGSELLMTGGGASRILIRDGGKATIRGGTLGAVLSPGGARVGGIQLDAGGELELFGTDFTLSNQPIPGLIGPGDSVIIAERNSGSTGPTLRGTFLDGETFSLGLQTFFSQTRNSQFSADGVVRVTLVPEPCSAFALLVGLICLLGQRSNIHRHFRQTEIALGVPDARGARGDTHPKYILNLTQVCPNKAVSLQVLAKTGPLHLATKLLSCY